MRHAVCRGVILVATVAFSLLISTAASAVQDRVTQGEAEAVLSAYGTGGQILRSDGSLISGAPADADAAATIRPFGASDGRHYCADDWHVIVLALIDGGDASYTREQAEAFLEQLTVTFSVDGEVLATDATPIKPYLDPESVGLETGYWFQVGTVMSPESLSVGKHTLVAVIEGIPDAKRPLVLRSTFYIDASGTGACL